MNGVATSCLTLKQALEKRGHEVHVIAPHNRIKGGTQISGVHHLPSLPFIVKKDTYVSFYSPARVRKLAAMGFDVVHTHSELAVGVLGRLVARTGGAALLHTYHTAW